MSGSLFELDDFEETRPAPQPGVVPVCSRCGARGEAIVPDGGMVVRDFGMAAQWALVALAAHDREMHPEAVRS